MAINWANDPPERRALPYLPVIRLKAGADEKIVATIDEPIACYCHFLGGRTLPCVDDHCPGCATQRRRIRECYVPACSYKTRQHAIWVLPPAAEIQLRDAMPNPSKIRGAILTLRRQGTRANGRVTVEVDEQRVQSEKLPPAPMLKLHLYQMWGLVGDQMGAEHPLWDVRDQFQLDELANYGTRVPPLDARLDGPNDSR